MSWWICLFLLPCHLESTLNGSVENMLPAAFLVCLFQWVAIAVSLCMESHFFQKENSFVSWNHQLRMNPQDWGFHGFLINANIPEWVWIFESTVVICSFCFANSLKSFYYIIVGLFPLHIKLPDESWEIPRIKSKKTSYNFKHGYVFFVSHGLTKLLTFSWVKVLHWQTSRCPGKPKRQGSFYAVKFAAVPIESCHPQI